MYNVEKINAPAVHSTWAKAGFMFSDGTFIFQFKMYNEYCWSQRTNQPLDKTQGWGAGFQESASNYQFFTDKRGKVEFGSKEEMEAYKKSLKRGREK